MPRLALWLAVLVSLACPAYAASQNLTLAQDAIQPQIAVDQAGNIYVVFIHQGNIAVAISRDRGKTFSQPTIAIDGKGKIRGGRQRGPRIGVDAQGIIYITTPMVLDEAEYNKKYPTADLVTTASVDGGKTWSQPLRINEVPKKAPEALHWMGVAPDGTVHVAWLDIRGRTDPGQDLYYARLEKGKVSPNVKIATEVCTCCAPGLALDAKGNPYIAYREGGDKESREIFALHSTDGGLTFSKPLRINTEPTMEFGCPLSAPAVAVSPDGKKFAAAWKVRRIGKSTAHIYWALGDAPALSKDTLIHSALAKHDHPALALGSKGDYWCVWEDARSGTPRIFARTSGKAEDFPVSDSQEGMAAFPSIVYQRGLAAVVYETHSAGKMSVRFRLLENSGP